MSLLRLGLLLLAMTVGSAVITLAWANDGAGKADTKKWSYTGFAKDRAGEAMLNSFRWGLDNRFHVSTSASGGTVRKADDKDSTAMNVRSQAFLFDPATLKFELTSGAG